MLCQLEYKKYHISFCCPTFNCRVLLVCWRFEGKKYELAKKFKMSIINHKWVEDCIKEGRCIPEAPYTFPCGQEVGLLMLDITLIRETIQLNHSKEPAIHIESEEDFNSWTDSTLLKENLSPEMGKYKDRPRRKSNVNIMNEDHPSSSKYCSDEHTLQGPHITHSLQGPHRTEIEELNFPSSASRKPKKRSSDSETSRRSRRSVKKNISGDLVEIISGSEKQSFRIQARQELETSAQFYNSDIEMAEISVNNRHGSSFSCYQLEPSRIDLDGIEETEVNRLLDNGDQSLHVESASSNLTGNRQEPCPAVDEVQNETDNTCKVSTSTALSCVICWTDFSSSRGCFPVVIIFVSHASGRGPIIWHQAEKFQHALCARLVLLPLERLMMHFLPIKRYTPKLFRSTIQKWTYIYFPRVWHQGSLVIHQELWSVVSALVENQRTY